LIFSASFKRLLGNIRLQVNYTVGIFFHSNEMIKPGCRRPEQLLISITCDDGW
jgi:hypothetical protein